MSAWDTSALLKLYLSETDSAIFAQLASGERIITSCAIARYEMETAFRRKEADGAIAAGDAELFQKQFAADLKSGAIVEVPLSANLEREFSAVLRKCQSQVPPVFVRTNDALHIAAALAEGESDFITADVRQRAAAILAGLKVFP